MIELLLAAAVVCGDVSLRTVPDNDAELSNCSLQRQVQACACGEWIFWDHVADRMGSPVDVSFEVRRCRPSKPRKCSRSLQSGQPAQGACAVKESTCVVVGGVPAPPRSERVYWHFVNDVPRFTDELYVYQVEATTDADGTRMLAGQLFQGYKQWCPGPDGRPVDCAGAQ